MLKKLACVAITLLLISSLTGCAGTSTADPARVKCPACGFEFDVNDRP